MLNSMTMTHIASGIEVGQVSRLNRCAIITAHDQLGTPITMGLSSPRWKAFWESLKIQPHTKHKLEIYTSDPWVLGMKCRICDTRVFIRKAVVQDAFFVGRERYLERQVSHYTSVMRAFEQYTGDDPLYEALENERNNERRMNGR